MKKNLLWMLAIPCTLLVQNSFAQHSSSELDKANTSKQVVTHQEVNSDPVLKNDPVVETSAPDNAELAVPSSFQFLIKDCELKENYYYLPEKKFLELTEQQQNYLLNNKTLFIIHK